MQPPAFWQTNFQPSPFTTNLTNQGLSQALNPQNLGQNFNYYKMPLQPVPIMEASLLATGICTLFRMTDAHFKVATGKNGVGHIKALMASPLYAFLGIITTLPTAMSIVGLWNYVLEKRRLEKMGIHTSVANDFKNSAQLSLRLMKTMVSSGFSQQAMQQEAFAFCQEKMMSQKPLFTVR